MNNEIYQLTLAGNAFYALLVLFSVEQYLKRKLVERHDRSIWVLLVIFLVWLFMALIELQSNPMADAPLSNKPGINTDVITYRWFLSLVTNAFFILAMKFFRPDTETGLGKIYMKVPWLWIAGIVAVINFLPIIFYSREETIPRDCADMWISSAVFLLFSLGMTLLFLHRHLPLMVILTLINFVVMVYAQGYNFKSSHPETHYWEVSATVFSDNTLGQVARLLTRPGLVFCVMLLAMTWMGEILSPTIKGNKDELSPTTEGNKLEFSLENGEVKISLSYQNSLVSLQELDLTSLSKPYQKVLFTLATATKKNEELGYKTGENLAARKKEMLGEISRLAIWGMHEEQRFFKMQGKKHLLNLKPEEIIISDGVEDHFKRDT